MSKVLHCITTIELGGAEKQLLILAANQIKMNLEVSVLYLKGTPDLQLDFERAGVKIVNDLANKNFIFQIFKFNKIVTENNLILHGHLPRAELLLALTKRGRKFIVTRHNSEKFFPRAPQIFSSLLSRFVLNKASKCIVISNAVKKFMIDYGELPKNKKAELIYYGFDSKLFLPKLTRKEGPVLVLGVVARLVPQKNHAILFYALREILKTNSNFLLIVIGDGYLREDLKILASKLKIEKRIVWIGKVSNPDFFINLMDIFILPSKYEGFGLVLLEAMQRFVPIIAAKNSSIVEVLGDTFPGLFATDNYIELSSKILSCSFENFYELENYYESRLKLFNPVQMTKKTLEVYGHQAKI